MEKKPVTSLSKGGNVPFVYSLSAKGIRHLETAFGVSPGNRRGTFSEHTLLVNDALIALVLAAKMEPCVRLVEMKHERAYKQQNIPVGESRFLEPDGFLHFQLSPPFGVDNESMGIFLEVDREKEGKAEIQSKLARYITVLSSGIYGLNAFTVAFCVPGGSIKYLVQWTEQAFQNQKEQAALFVFTNCDPAETSPLDFVTSPLWYQPFDTKPHALIERVPLHLVKNQGA